MNAAAIAVFALVWFIFAYLVYGKFIKNKVLRIDPNRKSAAELKKDGKDFFPTKVPILFGHHFSSISGAGPIVGPIIAFALFGWLPALLWILIGSVFIGGVHDYAVLTISSRNEGKSIISVAEKYISKRAGNVFAIFFWVTLTLIQAVFAHFTASSLNNSPEIVIPTLGIIAVAVGFGFAVYKGGMKLPIATILALVTLGALVYLGDAYGAGLFETSDTMYKFWLVVFFAYAFIAASLPVWTLLQPRDYLSTYILFIGLAAIILGLLVARPEINAPALISWNSKQGFLFPVLFIIIACGAVSGFHSMVASGTTSKQLSNEKHGRLIAYGGMLTEGLLATLVVLMLSSIMVYVCPGEGADLCATFGEYCDAGLKEVVYETPTDIFGAAVGQTVEFLGVPLGIGVAFGYLMVNAFILTTLDTSARLNRYIVQESLGETVGGVFNNKFFAAGLSLAVAMLLAFTGQWQSVWTLFGASNQLIASLALFAVTTYLLGFKAPTSYTLIPAIFMLVVSESALIIQIFTEFIPEGEWTMLIIAIILIVLGVYIAIEIATKYTLRKKEFEQSQSRSK